jgi:glycosyltransferase involved in cell wall biosynthesis
MINIHLYPSWILNESRMLREARTLAKLKLFDRIDLVGAGGPDLPLNEHLGAGIHIVRVGSRRDDVGLVQKILDTLNWSRLVYRAYRRQPVVCINSHSIATLPLACALKWATRARLVYDAHELETETSGLRGIRKAGTKIVERALIGSADYCIFVAAAINDWYRERYAITNTDVVYNCPVFADIPRSDRFREQFGIAPDVPIFLYQGVIGAERGVPKLVDAFVGLEGRAALVIMGYGELVPWVQSRAAQQSNVFYHAAVPPDRLLAYTAGADYGLSVIEPTSLSYEYCMPNKLFEYLMAGKPVLVSPTREQRDFVQRYGVGEVASDTGVPAIREAVLRLLARAPGSLRTAIDRVRREFSWETQETVLRRIYVDTLGFRPQEAPR